jgi:hypothetical protein
MEDRTQRYWVAESLNGPYRTPANNRLMPEFSHYAGNLVQYRSKELFFCWTTTKADGRSPFGLFPYSGQAGRIVPSPLEVIQAIPYKELPLTCRKLLEMERSNVTRLHPVQWHKEFSLSPMAVTVFELTWLPELQECWKPEIPKGRSSSWMRCSPALSDPIM